MSGVVYLPILFGIPIILTGCPAGDGGCEPCWGNYDIENGSDLEAASLCESITGNLRISEQDWITSINLPCLEAVGGDLSIEENACLSPSVASTFAGSVHVSGEITVANNGADHPCDG